MGSYSDGFNQTLQWRLNERDGVSNHRRLDGLLDRLFTCRSKKTSQLRVTGLCDGNHRGPVNSPHKGPVTRKLLPFDDVIMNNVRDQTAILWRTIYQIFMFCASISRAVVSSREINFWFRLSLDIFYVDSIYQKEPKMLMTTVTGV